MSRVFFDTNLFVYLLEDDPRFSPRVKEIVAEMRSRQDSLITSTLTVGEILVKPLSTGNTALVERIEEYFSLPGTVQVVPFDRRAATLYARIRVDKSVKAPDAVQLACAAAAGCDLFLTNDERLSRKHVPGIDFITSLDRAPL